MKHTHYCEIRPITETLHPDVFAHVLYAALIAAGAPIVIEKLRGDPKQMRYRALRPITRSPVLTAAGNWRFSWEGE